MVELKVKREEIAKVAKAIGSVTRWEILKLLKDHKMDVSRIAELLKQTEANISAQIKILERAGLIKSTYEPGEHGVRKVCELTVNRIVIEIE
ncbi:MAG: ArsR family transcriptional regulator [Candidatus Odinarchaeum yellowstonii]|uniref:ArsR family transcriptional regulator n=1 Tax=Odinarchaeota yellowstonii (strain LCB_4) TaxID=1841599 RepID=A0AAF0D3I4_ODILC|nr:MAG: ArsR family transcriptional regulator [Candidatus Odinarchaeum yellowstonii]